MYSLHTHNTTWIDGVAQWTPSPLLVATVGSVKYLGLEIDIDGSGKTQLALSRKLARTITSVISSRMAYPTLKYTVAAKNIHHGKALLRVETKQLVTSPISRIGPLAFCHLSKGHT